MKTVLLGERPAEVEAFLQRRHALGQDRYDEVWEGVYHVAPMASNSHGNVDFQLGKILGPYAERAGLVGTTAFNLGEPDDFRVPDGGYHHAHHPGAYFPTAAIVVEVVSPHDETWAKFGFYAAHGVDEICTAEPVERRVRWWRLCASGERDGERDGYVEVEASDLLGISAVEVAAQITWPD